MTKVFRQHLLKKVVNIACWLPSLVFGQDLEPRTYANTPVGLNFLILGYGHTEGGVATDPALPIENTQVELHTAVLAYARSFDFYGKSAKFDLILPYGSVEGSVTAVGEFRQRQVDGLIDPRFHISYNFFGAPALSMKEFADYQQDTIIGATLEITAPGGQYDADKLLNLGTNRWSIKPELGISKRLGPLTFELAGGVRFYTDNEQFLGDRLREQDPLYSVQGHLIYNIGYGIWLAADATFYTGGQTRVNGRKNDDNLENSRVGATLALPIDRYHSIKLYYSTGVSVLAGSNFDTTGIAWQYRFGDDL